MVIFRQKYPRTGKTGLGRIPFSDEDDNGVPFAAKWQISIANRDD
jgi:hypothetical protein